MAKQRMINTKFWDDGFIRSLQPAEKLLFLYLLTNPCTTIAGCYEITLDRILFDTGMDAKRVGQALEVLKAGDKITYQEGWIVIHNFIKNQSLSVKITKGIEDAVKCSPNWVKDTLSIRYDTLSYLNTNLKSKSQTKRKTKTASFDARFLEIFEEWKMVLGKRSSPDLSRQKTILDRIEKDHFTVEELKLVPHGVLRSPFHMGDNDKGTKYLEISTLFANREKVEKFIELSATSVKTPYALPTAAELIANQFTGVSAAPPQ